MTRKLDRRIIITILLLAVVLLCFCSEEKTEPVNLLLKFLPSGDEIPGWAMIDTVEIYKGEDLYLYINGGAEQYLHYGFKQVLACEYADSFETQISVEIFEMADTAAATGIYLEKAGEAGELVGLGRLSSLQDYYLNFVNDRYLVTLTGFEQNSRNLNGLIKIATAVDDRILGLLERR